MSDGKNCGACAHDCLGGICSGGQCQPVMIAQYIGNPMIIYVGAQAVYITTDLGYVGRANKDGSDLKPFAMPGFASSTYYGTLLAEDGDRVFLVRTGGSAIQLSYCLTTGCDATATPIGGQYTQFFTVDQSDHKIIWVDYSPSRLVSGSTTGTMSGVDVPGGTLASGSSGGRLFYSKGGIYFADGNGISRIPVAGGSVAGVTAGSAPLAILAANNTSLFLYDGRVIGSVPLPSGDGGSPKPLIATALSANVDGHFAADDSAMYWVSNSQANTCQISNCSGTQKALPKRAIDAINDVGIDAAAVYLFAQSGVTDNSTAVCTVWKLAK
jgi:hypothetical protein